MPRTARQDRFHLAPERRTALRRGEQPTVDELSGTRAALARAIRDLPDGAKYLPLFDAVNDEIERRQAAAATAADAVAAAIKFA